MAFTIPQLFAGVSGSGFGVCAVCGVVKEDARILEPPAMNFNIAFELLNYKAISVPNLRALQLSGTIRHKQTKRLPSPAASAQVRQTLLSDHLQMEFDNARAPDPP